MRVPVEAPLRLGNADPAQHRHGACPCLALRGRRVVHPVRLNDLPADRVVRMQRGERILEDHRHLPAAQPADLLVVEPDDVLAAHKNLAGYLGTPGVVQAEFNSAIVLITHDLGVVSQVADDVLVMYGGRAVERGSVEQVLRRPQHPYTWGLLTSVPTLTGDPDADLAPINGSPPSMINLPPGCAFHPRCRYADGTAGRSMTDVPRLEPAGEAGHLVACHLSSAQRRSLYQRDVAGAEVAR